MTLDEKIKAAIEEYIPLFDTETSSDLQGICYARAMGMFPGKFNPENFADRAWVQEVSDKILEGIYSEVEGNDTQGI